MSILWLFKPSKLSELKQTLRKSHHSTLKHPEGRHRWQSFFLFFIWVNQSVGMGKDEDTDGDTLQDTPGITDTRIVELHLCTSGRYHNDWIKKGSRDCESESCSVLCDSLRPLGYSPWNSPGQNTVWVAFPFSGGSLQPRDWIQISHIAGRVFTSWATREAQEYWSG